MSVSKIVTISLRITQTHYLNVYLWLCNVHYFTIKVCVFILIGAEFLEL